MLKRYLPVIFASLFLITSCSRSNSETTNDSTVVADTVENGNTDGDIFMNDTLRQAINNDYEWTKPDTTSEYEADEQMLGPHSSEIDIGGFSEDGQLFLFAQTNPGDYVGGDASVYVIDVAKNEWKGKPIGIKTTAEEEVPIGELRESAKMELDNLKKKYNAKEPDGTFEFIGVNHDNVVVVNGMRYVLELKTPDNLIDLHIKGNGKDIILQQDKKLPASRGAVRRYRLSKALVFGDKIAVFVEYDGPEESGFENERYYNRKNIAITGVVK